jgi:hypothetical protein
MLPGDGYWRLPGKFVVESEGIVRLAYCLLLSAQFAYSDVQNGAVREDK